MSSCPTLVVPERKEASAGQMKTGGRYLAARCRSCVGRLRSFLPKHVDSPSAPSNSRVRIKRGCSIPLTAAARSTLLSRPLIGSIARSPDRQWPYQPGPSPQPLPSCAPLSGPGRLPPSLPCFLLLDVDHPSFASWRLSLLSSKRTYHAFAWRTTSVDRLPGFPPFDHGRLVIVVCPEASLTAAASSRILLATSARPVARGARA